MKQRSRKSDKPFLTWKEAVVMLYFLYLGLCFTIWVIQCDGRKNFFLDRRDDYIEGKVDRLQIRVDSLEKKAKTYERIYSN